MILNKISLGNDNVERSEAKKNLDQRNLNLFVWMSGFHDPLVHTDFNMFVDEWTSANESPAVHLSCATTGKNWFELVTASFPTRNGSTP